MGKSGWAYSARVNGKTVSEDSQACSSTLSSMMTEINAVTLALRWAINQPYSRLVFVTDSLSTLEKIRREFACRLDSSYQCQQHQENHLDLLPRARCSKRQRDSRQTRWECANHSRRPDSP